MGRRVRDHPSYACLKEFGFCIVLSYCKWWKAGWESRNKYRLLHSYSSCFRVL